MEKEIEGITKQYSPSFKRKVVSEIESGKLNKNQARSIYSIGGGTTIHNWIKKFGKLHLLNKVIRIEMKDEVSKLKQLEQEKRELESALAKAHIKLVSYESLIQVAEEELGIDLKKNLKSERLSSPVKNSRKSK